MSLIHLVRATRNKSSELRIAAGSRNFIISAEIMNDQSPVTRIANFSYRIFYGPERNDVINLITWQKDVLEYDGCRTKAPTNLNHGNSKASPHYPERRQINLWDICEYLAHARGRAHTHVVVFLARNDQLMFDRFDYLNTIDVIQAV
jgi:hypothetical protein